MISWQIPAHELMIMQQDGQAWRLGQGGGGIGRSVWGLVFHAVQKWSPAAPAAAGQALFGTVQTCMMQLLLNLHVLESRCRVHMV